jgi:hypothetical protein
VIACLAAAMGGLILLQSGACLWWRLVRAELWERRADAGGGLQQATGWTCYPAAAVMLLHHYGIAAGEGEMAYSANTSLWGTDDHAMARAMTARGYPAGWRARVEITDYEACVRQGGPFIAQVVPPTIGPHALFVRSTGPESLRVIDPLDGVPKELSRTAFESMWTGRLIRFLRREESSNGGHTGRSAGLSGRQ